MTRFILLIFFTIFSVNAFAQKEIKSFELSQVRLLDGPFKQAQQTDLVYMLALNPDRLLAPYLKEAGLNPKAESYGNWENTGLDGHIGGHYLSALSLMYAATGDAAMKARMDYMIDELEKCQIKNGDGYISGIPGGREIFRQIKNGNIKSASFSLNGKWVPLYNIHKIYAGLYDSYAQTGNLKAEKMLIKLTDWCVDLVGGLSDPQVQDMLRSEHGGLNEIFAHVYSITGEQKYLQLARRFSDHSILDPLLAGKDALNGLHANTQIPKVIGFEQIALADQDSNWANAAEFFWKTVTEKRTVAIGGNSVREHFHPANDFSSMMESREGPETCNSYNMLKLTRQLFLSAPSNKYMDYYESTIYNHILTSQRAKGGFVYFTPMRPGHYRTYSSPQESFWCCVGSGLENHGKYGELIYAHNNNDIYVNLFIPSTLNWKEQGLELVQQSSFPNTELSTLKLKLQKNKQFSLIIRRPSWLLNSKMKVLVNGKTAVAEDAGNGYISVNRIWKNGDVVKVLLPMKTTAEFLPDGSDWVAFKHGPIVLAAEIDTLNQPNLTADGSRMGHIASGTLFAASESPLVVGSKTDLAKKLTVDEKIPFTFHAENAIYQPKYRGLKLVPFYSLAEKRYIIYFPFSSLSDLPERARKIREAEAEKMELEIQTIELVNTGEQQPESDHHFMGEGTETGLYSDQHYRNGNGWFSYKLKNKDLAAKKIRLKLNDRDRNRHFALLINDRLIENLRLDGKNGNKFYTQDFTIPADLLQADLEIKFRAEKGSAIANIYEVRLLK